jgi:hypothetical protein
MGGVKAGLTQDNVRSCFTPLVGEPGLNPRVRVAGAVDGHHALHQLVARAFDGLEHILEGHSICARVWPPLLPGGRLVLVPLDRAAVEASLLRSERQGGD